MTFPYQIDQQKFYELAADVITGLALIFGFGYLKQIVAFVLMELYKYFIQGGPVNI